MECHLFDIKCQLMYITYDLLNNTCNPCEHKTNLLEIDTLDLQL